MGLKFSKLEPVQFGDIVVTPEIDEETKLRLYGISFGTLEGVKEGIEVMSSCFKEKSKIEDVKEFMTTMSNYELNQLQAYLMGGQAMLDKLEKQIDAAITKELA